MADKTPPAAQKSRVWVIASLIFLPAIVAWWVLGHQEPVYKNKSLSSWMEQYYQTHDGLVFNEHTNVIATNSAALNSEAADALKHIGTNAIPYYLKLANTSHNPVTAKILGIRFLYRVPVLRWQLRRWVKEDSQNPEKAMIGFQLLGPAAQPAVRSLAQLLRPNQSWWRLRPTTSALSAIGPGAKAALPELVQKLKGPDSVVRDLATSALLSICQDRHAYTWRPDCVSIAVHELVKTLHDKDTDVRIVFQILGDFGPDAKMALPSLIPYMKSQDRQIRSAAMNALEKIDSEAAAKAKSESP